MLIEYWADYICPWCYLALDRVRHLTERHGVEVRWRPFELHPEIPPDGGEAPVIRRTRDTSDWLRTQLEEAGLTTATRTTWSNSRLALALSVWAEDLPQWPELHVALYSAYWAEGRDLGDPEELKEIATGVGIAHDAVTRALADGSGFEGVAAARDRALDLGIAATPGWHLPDGAVFTGVHERDVFDRVVAKARSRNAEQDHPHDNRGSG
ncbi:MAG: DsbA family protein [Acidimicrobiia bacterium]